MNDEQELPPHGDQDARNAKARREMARAAGVALIGATAALEEGTFDKGTGPMELVMLTQAARGRRLLRSFYRLVDAGEPAEAAPLLRVMHETLIVMQWLLADPEKHLTLWIKDDLRKRDVVRDRLMADPDVGEELRQAVEDERAAERAAARELFAAAVDEAAEEVDEEPCPSCGHAPKRRESRMPPVEQMAAHVDLKFAYNLAYRMQSQADVHATALAVDNALIRNEDGSIMLRAQPDFGLSNYESYQLGAHILLGLLRPAANQWPDLGWGSVLDAVAASLDAIMKSDPEYRPRTEPVAGDGQ